MRGWIWAGLVAGISGCAPSTPETRVEVLADPGETYSAMATSELWYLYGTTAQPRQLLLVEAELGARGETTSGSAYIGQRTSGTVGRALYARPELAASADDRNCSDFASSAAAQGFFLASGGPVTDPHGLDRDGDGNACEWGTTITTSAAAYRPRPAPAVRTTPRYSSSVCHVGPRGGTYTITASGNKNYGGC